MRITHQPLRQSRSVLHLALSACFAAGLMAAVPAHADVTSDLKAELAAQRTRLEMLEKKLEEATREAAEAKATAKDTATKVASAPAATGSSSGLTMPKGFAVYGIIDGGLENANYGQGNKTRIQSGLGSASRLGFKGERTFANSDLTAYFQLEAGVSIDNGQNTGHSSNVSNPGQGAASSSAPNTTGVAIFSRNTYAGLKGKFGDIRVGRDYAPIYSITSATDPFSIGGATAFRLWSGAAASRFDNAVFYTTPSLGGVQASVAYSAGMENNSRANVGLASGATTSTGPEGEGKGWSGSVSYKNGPLFVAGGYLNYLKTGAVTAPATEDVRRTSKNLAVSYDFKSVKLFGHYLLGNDFQAGKSAATAKTMDRTVWWLGVAVPFNEVHTFRAVYGHLDDKMSTNQDSNHIGVGYEYALDKETDLYAYYARVSNQNGGQNSLCAGGTCQGYDKDTNLPAGFSPRSLMVGGRYRF